MTDPWSAPVTAESVANALLMADQLQRAAGQDGHIISQQLAVLYAAALRHRYSEYLQDGQEPPLPACADRA